MSELFAALIGSLTTLLCVSVALGAILRMMLSDASLAMNFSARLMQAFAERAGFESLVVPRGDGQHVVTFEAVVDAIDRGRLLSSIPVSFEPDDTESEESCDGRA